MGRFPSLRRASGAATAAAALCLALGGSARAAPFVDVTYDLVEATGAYSMLAFRHLHPPRFDLSEHVSGTQTIRYSSESASGALDGPVSLRAFELTMTAPAYYPTYPTPIKAYTATLHLRAANLPLAGALSGGAVDLGAQSPLLRITGRFHCYADCSRLDLPTTVSTTIQPTTETLRNAHFFTAKGASTLNITMMSFFFRFDPGEPSTKDPYTIFPERVFGALYYVDLVGREVSRTPVPEPGSLALVSVGLGALALCASAAGWVARRRGGG